MGWMFPSSDIGTSVWWESEDLARFEAPAGGDRIGLEPCRVRKIPLLLLFSLLLGAPALAQEWFRPAHRGPGMTNVDLTPVRALRGSVPESWDGQMVLWEGRVRRHDLVAGRDRLVLATEAGDVLVLFSRQARNLEFDRSGYRVAVKGILRVGSGRTRGLDGLSVILLAPPQIWGFQESTAGRPPDLVQFLTWVIGFHNPHVPGHEADGMARSLVRAASENSLDPFLLASLIQIESAWDVDAVSSSGAVGLGQLMPFTAQGLGVDPTDPDQNLQGAARMLAGLLREWQHLENPRAAALSGYNSGPNRVRRLGGRVPALPEPTNYVFFIGYVHRNLVRLARAFSVGGPEPGSGATSRPQPARVPPGS